MNQFAESRTSPSELPSKVPTASCSATPAEERWRNAAIALALSVIPGCGHFYAGYAGRGLLWSAFFLGAVIPAAAFLYMILSFTAAAPFWILLCVGLLMLVSAVGSLLCVLGHAPRRFDGTRETPSLHPAPWSIGVYAFLLLLTVVLESAWLLGPCLDEVPVRTKYLEPLAERHESVHVLLSEYVRPVYGDLVLFESSAALVAFEDNEPREHILGRVLAVPGDAAGVKDCRLLVNGVWIDLKRNVQRRALDRAGRSVRQKALLSILLGDVHDVSEHRAQPLPLAGGEWKLYLPRKTYLVVPDIELSEPPLVRVGTSELSAPHAWLVEHSDILGRALP